MERPMHLSSRKTHEARTVANTNIGNKWWWVGENATRFKLECMAAADQKLLQDNLQMISPQCHVHYQNDKQPLACHLVQAAPWLPQPQKSNPAHANKTQSQVKSSGFLRQAMIQNDEGGCLSRHHIDVDNSRISPWVSTKILVLLTVTFLILAWGSIPALISVPPRSYKM